jgi:gluconate 2-dehydrogenase gamma chain
MDISRRDWLTTSWLLAVWPEVAAAQEHAHQVVKSSTPPVLGYLDAATAREIAALVECILPSDDTPGAKEAGVIYFIDRALTTFAADQQNVYRDGLLAAQAKRKELFPESESIAGLSEEQQIELLKSLEGSEFFRTLRFHTLAGFLAEPSYGGNRDGAGWKLIGFDNSMVHEPPFGYYDREAREVPPK